MAQQSLSFNDFEVVTVRRNNYKINFCFMTKSETADRMKNAGLGEKSRQPWLNKNYLL